MIAYERVKKIVLGTEDPSERKIRLLALLTSSLPKTTRRPVLAGGSAIEVYLDGMLRTGDMDVVYDTAALEKVMKAWRFERGNGLRTWANDELGLAVDPVGETLNGSYDRVTTITTDYGPATIIGLEDLILRRLASAKFWKVPTDMEQAYLLARAHGEKIDWKYVEVEAKRLRITEYLVKLRAMIEAGGR